MELNELISLTVSLIAIIFSGITLWITLFKRGKIKMTQPSVIFFGPDGYKTGGRAPKVYLRTLFFSTSKKGHIIESIFVKLYRGESVQAFNIWVHGETRSLNRGSGLFIGENGMVANHHFLLPKDGTNFEYLAGAYKLELYVKVLGHKTSSLKFTQELNLTEDQSKKIIEEDAGVFFDWSPDYQKYRSHIDMPPTDDPFLNPIV